MVQRLGIEGHAAVEALARSIEPGHRRMAMIDATTGFSAPESIKAERDVRQTRGFRRLPLRRLVNGAACGCLRPVGLAEMVMDDRQMSVKARGQNWVSKRVHTMAVSQQ